MVLIQASSAGCIGVCRFILDEVHASLRKEACERWEMSGEDHRWPGGGSCEDEAIFEGGLCFSEGQCGVSRAMLHACCKGHLENAKLLFRHGGALVETCDPDSDSKNSGEQDVQDDFHSEDDEESDDDITNASGENRSRLGNRFLAFRRGGRYDYNYDSFSDDGAYDFKIIDASFREWIDLDRDRTAQRNAMQPIAQAFRKYHLSLCSWLAEVALEDVMATVDIEEILKGASRGNHVGMVKLLLKIISTVLKIVSTDDSQWMSTDDSQWMTKLVMIAMQVAIENENAEVVDHLLSNTGMSKFTFDDPFSWPVPLKRGNEEEKDELGHEEGSSEKNYEEEEEGDDDDDDSYSYYDSDFDMPHGRRGAENGSTVSIIDKLAVYAICRRKYKVLKALITHGAFAKRKSNDHKAADVDDALSFCVDESAIDSALCSPEFGLIPTKSDLHRFRGYVSPILSWQPAVEEAHAATVGPFQVFVEGTRAPQACPLRKLEGHGGAIVSRIGAFLGAPGAAHLRSFVSYVDMLRRRKAAEATEAYGRFQREEALKRAKTRSNRRRRMANRLFPWSF